jgi:ATP-dependent exoDNAse (exonuclease V) alpha subunit
VGDIAQLPPVSDRVLYHNKPRNDLETQGYCMYCKFETVIRLEVNERAKGCDPEQERFRQLQLRARDGDSSLDDWKLLLTRQPASVQNIAYFQENAVKLSYSNEKVAKDNYTALQRLNNPIIQIDAQHNSTQAKQLSADDIGGLQPTLYIAKSARVMLTRNLWTAVCLCNGAVGTVLHIVYAEGQYPPALPIAIIVQFDEKDYSGPSFSTTYPNCVPLYPVTSNSETYGQKYERQQYPLKLAWSITIHKAQGLTLKNVWIDLGSSEKATGMTYVALSQAKKISDMIIEPMTFGRLSAVKKTSNFKYRILEENRLQQLSEKRCKQTANQMTER